MKKVFVGSINWGRKPTCGETVKNQYLLRFLQDKFGEISYIDTYSWRKKLSIQIRLLWLIIKPFDNHIILSTCNKSSYSYLKLIYHFKKRNKITYFVIGGSLGKLIISGEYKKKYYLNIDNIIVEGEKMRSELLAVGIENVSVVPNFKEICYIPLKKSSGSIFKFVFLSRIIPEKGVDLIFKAVELLNVDCKNEFVVDFYGIIDDNYKKVFNSKLQLFDNINHRGFLDLLVKSNYDILSEYDAMLFPTMWKSEGFPGVIIDSFIAGLPVIASDWNLNSELIISNETGLLIPPGNIDELYKSMKLFVKNKEIVTQMSVNCQSLAPKFDMNNVLNSEFLNIL